MNVQPIDLLLTLQPGESLEFHNFDGDILDSFYTPSNRAGIRIKIEKVKNILIVTRTS